MVTSRASPPKMAPEALRLCRSVSMATSPDLRKWSEPVALKYPGSPHQQMYTNGIAPYFRAKPMRAPGKNGKNVLRNLFGQLAVARAAQRYTKHKRQVALDKLTKSAVGLGLDKSF